MKFCIKDPEAVLDYCFDWSTWLETGETIVSHEITVGTGITVDSSSEENGIVTVWLSGGEIGMEYNMECLIVTNTGREDERTMKIRVMER